MLSFALFHKTKQLLYSHSFDWAEILKHILWQIRSLLMKIIITVHQLLFYKTTDLYTLDTKTWKNILSSYESKKHIWICRQLEFHQLRIRSDILILLEMILNALNVWQYHLPSQILILAVAPLLFISVSILCELAMLPGVYILLSSQEEQMHSSSWQDICKHWSKRLNPLSVIIFCYVIHKKTRLKDKLLRH